MANESSNRDGDASPEAVQEQEVSLGGQIVDFNPLCRSFKISAVFTIYYEHVIKYTHNTAHTIDEESLVVRLLLKYACGLLEAPCEFNH